MKPLQPLLTLNTFNAPPLAFIFREDRRADITTQRVVRKECCCCCCCLARVNSWRPCWGLDDLWFLECVSESECLLHPSKRWFVPIVPMSPLKPCHTTRIKQQQSQHNVTMSIVFAFELEIVSLLSERVSHLLCNRFECQCWRGVVCQLYISKRGCC